MRTEQEFLALVEEKIKAGKPKRQIPVRIALAAAAALLLTAALLAGSAALRSDAPADTEQPLITPDTASPAVPEAPIAPAPSVPVAPEIPTPETMPSSASSGETAPETSHDLAPGQMGIFLSAARTYRGVVYRPIYTSVLPLNEEDIGREITDSLGDTLPERLYTMRGISEDYFLLVDQGGLRGLINDAYRPANLGELITALNFARELEFGWLYTNERTDGQNRTWQIDGLDAEVLWAMLFAMSESVPERLTVKIDPEAIQHEAAANGAQVTPPYDPTGQYLVDRNIPADLTVSISLPRLGLTNRSIMVSREGWLWTNLLSSGAYFAVSPTLCDDILTYARQAGEWTDITPIVPTEVIPGPEIVVGEAPSDPESAVTAAVTATETIVVPAPPQGP